MTLNEAIAAVVVSNQQAVGRDQFAGTATAEQNNAVLHAMVVDTIDIVGGQAEAHLLHFSLIVAKEQRDPHSFIGEGENSEKDQKGEGEDFFHNQLLFNDLFRNLFLQIWINICQSARVMRKS